jgi:hypothetical protein
LKKYPEAIHFTADPICVRYRPISTNRGET